MKVIQVTYCFYPDPVGGTEIYVEALSRNLQQRGVEVILSAPSIGTNETYLYNGLKVRRFQISNKIKDINELYGDGDANGAREFAKILDEEKPSLVHLHAFTSGVSLSLLREIKSRKIPVLFTYHTPAVSCQRGTLMRWGRFVCNGKLELNLCVPCTLHQLGLPKIIALLIGKTPVIFNEVLKKIRLSTGILTLLRMRGLTLSHFQAIHAFMNEVDHIIAVCDWSKDLLILNGVSRNKITVVRHGISFAEHSSIKIESLYTQEKPVKIAYFGRINPVKGVDIVIRAIRSLKEEDIEFHVYGIVQSKKEFIYLKELKQLAADDKRIFFKDAIANEKLMFLLTQYHFVAVPSRWLETGPLIVLEAFGAGVPIIGSDFGGIKELVSNGVNGILVKPNYKAWKNTLRLILKDNNSTVIQRKNIRPPKAIEDVASEMYELYRKFEYKGDVSEDFNKNVLISVVIPTLNRGEDLCNTIRYFLEKETYGPFELIVIDQSDSHSDNVESFLLSVSRKITYKRVGYKSLPRARNEGVKLAKGSIIVFVDDDVEIKEGFLIAHLLSYSNPMIWGVAGPATPGTRLFNQVEIGEERFYSIISQSAMSFDVDFEFFASFASGCNMSFRKEVIEKLGGFDENFYGGALGEDAEFCHRVKQFGGKILYSPKAYLVHKSSRGGGQRSNLNEYVKTAGGSANYFWWKIGAGFFQRKKAVLKAFRFYVFNKANIVNGKFVILSFWFLKGVLESNMAIRAASQKQCVIKTAIVETDEK